MKIIVLTVQLIKLEVFESFLYRLIIFYFHGIKYNAIKQLIVSKSLSMMLIPELFTESSMLRNVGYTNIT